MGAQQSSAGAQNRNASEVKKCYYEVLGVARNATDDEIKKAYRKKALELHPDRNYGDEENATAKFAEVRSANEVLSDPQERAWYDSHRESILRGDSGGEEDHFEHNVRLTSAGDNVSLMSKFNTSVPFTDAPNGFYGILQEAFATLAAEEDSACDWGGLQPVDYPNFGSVLDGYDDTAKPFYRVWMSFSTKKSFSWRDAYKTSDGPDRATRRLIEKENKRLRDEGIREFNDAVRSLVAFVRKRDPRFIPNTQSELDRQKILRDAVATQAARSRAANQAKLQDHVLPTWAQSNHDQEDEFTESESEKSEVEHIECVICEKTFKSEKQYETHEKSKKHTKAVQQLQREMRKENKRLNLDTPPSTLVSDLDVLELGSERNEVASDGLSDVSARNNEAVPEQHVKGPEFTNIPSDTLLEDVDKAEDGPGDVPESLSGSEQDDEYAPREAVENRLDPLAGNSSPKSKETKNSAADTVSDTKPKLGKAKQKKAKKAAKESQQIQEDQEFKCLACTDSFSSKNELFSHIKEYKHAQPKNLLPIPIPKGRNKKR